MTPARQQNPQQEYLPITSEELLIVEHGCIYPDKDKCIGKRCKYHDPNPSFKNNVVCLLNEHDVADQVRSRPHTSATAPAQPIESTKGMEHRKSRLDPDGSTGAPEREESRHTCTNLNEHDAQVAKAEREQVLDEICRINTEDNVCKKGKDCKSCLMESLRAQQEQP